MGQRGRADAPRKRAPSWISLICLTPRSSAAAMASCIGPGSCPRRRWASSRSRASETPAPRGPNAGEQGRIGDLIAVEVKDRQHRAVRKSDSGTCSSAMPWPRARSPPRRRQRHRRRSARGCRTPPERMAQGIAELPALVDRARTFRRGVGWRCQPGKENCMKSFLRPASLRPMSGYTSL